jgi:hypothetical protein
MQNMRIDKWLHETEGFSTRIERLAEDMKSGNVSAIVPWLEAAFDLGSSSSEALDALRNAKGFLDTPIKRRHHMEDEFYVEVVRSINEALDAASSDQSTVGDQASLFDADVGYHSKQSG